MIANVPLPMPVVFYRTGRGVAVVRDWLRELDPPDRNAIGLDLMRIQFRWPVGMRLCRPMGDGLWEVRSELPSRRIARILFCVLARRIVILHGFVKKTRATPDAELALARRRRRELEE